MPPGDDDAALRVAEDDGDPVRAEQNPGMVSEVADDVGHVQPGRQVGGDATQGLGAPQAARGLFRGAGAPHQDTQGPGDRGCEPAAIVGTQLHGARDREQTPGSLAAGDRDEQLIGAHAQHREGGRVTRPRMDRLGALERPREQARTPRDAGGCACGPFHVGGAGDEAARPPLPDPDEGGAGRDSDPVARLVKRGVETGRERGDLREVGQQVQTGGRLGQGGGLVSPDPPGRATIRTAGRDRGFGRRKEALEVSQAVPPVATLVDPVVAEAARLAPGADRVRVHPENLRRPRDGEGRVARAGGPGAG